MSNRRNTNIELLRILSMMMIIAGHFAGQGGLLDTSEKTISRLVICVFGSGQRIAINLFLIISVWFLVDQEFKAIRIIKIWLEVLFYTVLITVIVQVFIEPVSIKDFIQAFMPFLGRPLWFASAYIALLLLSPFLKKVTELPPKQHGSLVIVLGIITCVLPTIATEMDNYLCAVIWFCFVYILVGYYKHYVHPTKINAYLCLAVGIALYIGMSSFTALNFDSKILVRAQLICSRFLHDFKTIPNVFISFCVFFGFINMKPRYSKFVNELAAGSFAVYIIHQTPVFYPILWRTLINSGLFDGKKLAFSFLIAVPMIYLLFSTIDEIRRKKIEPRILKTKIIYKISKSIQSLYY